MDWRLAANCRNEDPKLFFPRDDTYRSRLQIDLAKTICGRCNVRDECLRSALEENEPGIWGGTTRRERTGETDPWDPWEGRWGSQEAELTKIPTPAGMPGDVIYMLSIDSGVAGLIEEGFQW